MNKTTKTLIPGWQRSSESEAGLPTTHTQSLMSQIEQKWTWSDDKRRTPRSRVLREEQVAILLSGRHPPFLSR